MSQQLHQIREGAGVLEGVGAVGVEEAAAVGAQLLDRLLRGDRTERHHLLGALDGGDLVVGREVLDHPLAHQDQGEDQAHREKHVDRAPDQVGPEIADGPGRARRQATGEPAGQGDGNRDPRGSRDEVVPGQSRHLGQVAHRRFAAVRLPVGVGGEAGRGVEGQRLLHPSELLRVEGQESLEAEDAVGHQHAEEAEDHQRPGVANPGLLVLRVHPGEPEEESLHRAEDARERLAVALEHPGHEDAERLGRENDQS